MPKPRYPDPKPYSYSVTDPTIVYREVEHIRPPAYETPVPHPDVGHIYPEGYTNEYDDYYIDNYFGSDGRDHHHYRYDNIADIDLDHGHWDPDPHARAKRFQPDVDAYFVPQIKGPVLRADYDGDLDPHDELRKESYKDPTTGVYYSLFDGSLIPGQSYTPDYHYNGPENLNQPDVILGDVTYGETIPIPDPLAEDHPVEVVIEGEVTPEPYYSETEYKDAFDLSFLDHLV